MKPNPLRANWELVRLTESALRHGTEGLGSLPAMLKALLKEHAWQEFELPNGDVQHWERFADFITAGPPRGLGADVDLIRRTVADDPMALDLLDQAVQNRSGHPQATVNNINSRPEGTSKDQALRRLRKDRPDLHARVLAKELSPHRAMVEAGFRRPTITVPADSPEAIARTLRRHFTAKQLAELRGLL